MKKIPSIKELRKRCYKKPTSWIAGKLYRGLSIYLTKVFLHTSLTPNQISGMSIVVGVLCGVFLSFGKFWFFIIGGICFILSAILDRVDGEIARFRKMPTPKGRYLELLNYHIVLLSTYTGLILGVYRILGNSLVLLFGLFMILFNVLIRFATVEYHKILLYDMIEKGKYKKGLIGDLLFPKKLKKVGWEINMIISSNDYIIYWIIIGAILDLFMPKIRIYSFTMNYLMLFIIFQMVMGFFKLIVTLAIHLLPKKSIKM